MNSQPYPRPIEPEVVDIGPSMWLTSPQGDSDAHSSWRPTALIREKEESQFATHWSEGQERLVGSILIPPITVALKILPCLNHFPSASHPQAAVEHSHTTGLSVS